MGHRSRYFFLASIATLAACNTVYVTPDDPMEGLRSDDAVCPRVACNRFDADDNGVASSSDLIHIFADGCDSDELADCFPDIDGNGVQDTSDIVEYFAAGLSTEVDQVCDDLPACPLAFDTSEALLGGRLLAWEEAAANHGIDVSGAMWDAQNGETITGLVPADMPFIYPNGTIEGPIALPEKVDAYVQDHGDTDPRLLRARRIEALATFGLLNPADPIQQTAISEYIDLMGGLIDLDAPPPEPEHSCAASCNLYLRTTNKTVTADAFTSCTGRTDATLMHEALAWCYDEWDDDWQAGVSLVHQQCTAQADVMVMCFTDEGVAGDCDQEQCILEGRSDASVSVSTEANRNSGVWFDWGGGSEARSESFGRVAVLDWGGDAAGDIDGGHISVRAIADTRFDHCGASRDPLANCVITGGLSGEGPSVGVECPISDITDAFVDHDGTDLCEEAENADNPFCKNSADITICDGDLADAYQRIDFSYSSDDGFTEAADNQTMTVSLKSDGITQKYVHLLDVRADNLLYVRGYKQDDDWDGTGGDTYAGTGHVESRDVLVDVRSLDTITSAGHPMSCEFALGYVPEGTSYNVAKTTDVAIQDDIYAVLPDFDTVVRVGCYGDFIDGEVGTGTCDGILEDWDPLTAPTCE